MIASARRPARRSGALLIAVLGLLTLFAIFALFFVFYADAEATGARIAREKESPSDVDPPNDFATAAFNFTLRSVLFDDYDTSGVLNPLRGHSLSRSMYGWNGTLGVQPTAPFSGVGTFHETPPTGSDRAFWVNYSAAFTIPSGPTAGTYFLDPEWTGFRTSTQVQAGQQPGTIAGQPQSFVPKNAPYTYPDLNNLILASLSPATGEVLVKSLHRDWLFNGSNPNPQFRLAPWNPSDSNPATMTSANTDWVSPEGRTKVLRPRPVDQLVQADFVGPIPSGPLSPSAAPPYPIAPGMGNYNAQQLNGLYNLIYNRIQTGQIIPYPFPNADGSFTGDVQNLQGGVGQNGTPGSGIQRSDSILIDLGLPPRRWNGKWIKPLAAILLSDLDGLLNINVHGNLRNDGSHGSYAGYGPHEVNLNAVLGNNAEAFFLILKRYGVTQWQQGTPYGNGSVVFNRGNFYRCETLTGGISGSGMGATGPLGSGNGIPDPNSPTPITWSSYVSVSIPRNSNTAIPASYELYPDRSRSRFPSYAPVNWDSAGSVPAGFTAIQMPLFPPAMSPMQNNAFTTAPLFYGIPPYSTTNLFDDNAFDGNEGSNPLPYNKYQNNPLLFNPNEWPATGVGPRTFPLSDLKRFSLRYAGDIDWLRQTDYFNVLNKQNPAMPAPGTTGLIGNAGTFSGNRYRLDPAHGRRGLTTTLSTTLDLPGMASNFNTSVAGTPVLVAANVQNGQLHPTNAAFGGTFSPGAGADFSAPTDWRNPKALWPNGDPRSGILGAVDVNRPLTDYRSDTNTPLGQPSKTNPLDMTNSGNYLQAWVDRHNLARDILGRLIVATGANAIVFSQATSFGTPAVAYQAGDILINATPGNPDYNAIRYLAQLAANMVDLIDNDDISTTFVWDAGAGWTTPRTITQVDTTTLPALAALVQPTNPGGIVYGVEKPRLLLSEAYGEITNNPNEVLAANMPAAQNARVRFWVELMNPTNSPYAAGTGPLGTGGVTLYNGTFSPYQLQVVQAGAVITSLSDPANTSGTVTVAANTGFTFDFNKVGAQLNVLPINGVYAPANGSPGIILVGAADYGANQHTVNGTTVEFRPNGNAPYNTQMIVGNQPGMGNTAMEYELTNMPAASSLETVATMNPFRRHVVLLRRLANPYLDFNAATNPYITVDFMDWVPAYDAVVRGGGMGDTNNRTPKGNNMITAAGFEQVDGASGGIRRASVGKVQPYAGFAAGATPVDVTEVTTFPVSMVVKQNPANPPAAGEPLHTFFRMNGRNAAPPGSQTYNPGPPATLTVGGNTETLMAPFDWFVHFDRTLVNQLELLSLQATKPHEVTQFTIRNNGGTLARNWGLTPWLGINAANQPGYDLTNNRTNNGLYRAFELLRTKPWMYGTGFGGKLHGKLNINTIQDARVFSGLFDVGAANYFTAADVGLAWTGQSGMPSIPGLITNPANAPLPGSRTVNSATFTLADGSQIQVPVPGPTVDDLPNPSGQVLDRPFRSLGAAEYAPDTNMPPSLYASRLGSGLQDTLLRVNPTTGAPMISVTSQAHPYLQAEMVRKIHNNTTTTSHAFALTVTIVFHEVRMSGANPMAMNEGAGNRFLIGKEVYKDVPGDLRQQFYAVIDRSNLVLQPPGSPQGGQFQTRPINVALDQPIVLGQYAPTTPPMGFQMPPAQSYNVYLTGAIPSNGGQPYTFQGNFGLQTTVYADGQACVLTQGSWIMVGVGTGQEPQALQVNYVNQDGSLNVGGGAFPTFSKSHVVGELVSNYVPGNPGPQPLINGNPIQFDYRQNQLWGAIVPYAQRVK